MTTPTPAGVKCSRCGGNMLPEGRHDLQCLQCGFTREAREAVASQPKQQAPEPKKPGKHTRRPRHRGSGI